MFTQLRIIFLLCTILSGFPMNSDWFVKPESYLVLSFEYSTTSKFLTRPFKEWCDWIIWPLENCNICFVLCGKSNSHHLQKKKGKKKRNKNFKTTELRQRWYILGKNRSGLLANIKWWIKVQQWQQTKGLIISRGKYYNIQTGCQAAVNS